MRSDFWIGLILAAGISGLITGVVVKFGKKLGIIDDPKTHIHPKVVHERAVPRGGGLPIYAAVAVTTVIMLPMSAKLAGILIGATMLVVTGFIDDKFEEAVSPYVRLLINALAAVAVIGAGIGIAYITNPLGGILHLDWPRFCFTAGGTAHCLWILSDLFALLWLMAMQNFVGWSSGVDGQLPGFVVIAAVTMAILGQRFGNDASQNLGIVLAGVTAGAYLGFLPWNWYPQKIIPGYGGKSLAGFLLGVLAILSVARVGAMFLVLGIPLIDAGLVIIKRLREGRSPVFGGREHLHHYLLEMGWGKRRIAVFYWLAALLMAILAVRLNSTSKYFTMAAVVMIVGGAILWLHYFSTYLKPPGRDSGSRT